MPASVPATAPGYPLRRGPQEHLAHACLGFGHPTRVPLMWGTQEPTDLHTTLPPTTPPGQSCTENPGSPGPHPTRVLPVPKHPGTIQLAPTLASVILQGYPTEREPWDHPIPCPLQLQLSYQGASYMQHTKTPRTYTPPQPQLPTRTPSTQILPFPTPESAPAALLGCPLCREPQDTLACTHFGLSYPARAPSV